MMVPYLWMEFCMFLTTSLDTSTFDRFNIFIHKPWYNMETLCEFENFWNYHCRNPSLGLTTKARACKGASQEGSPRITFHALGNLGKCEGMNPHTPKWDPTLKVGVPMDF
jgi:hypothetical protein